MITSRGVDIELCGVTREFRGQVVLDGIDLVIASGSTCAIVGNNGAGKSTLLRCLAGLLRPSQGKVTWRNLAQGDCQPLGPCDLRRIMGVVGHASPIYSFYTVRENLMFAARMRELPNPHVVVSRVIESAMLTSFAEKRGGALSRGMLQRVSIALAVMHDPQIVVLDEPDTGLDQAGIEWLADTLENLTQRGCTTIFASHRGELVERLTPRVLRMVAGNLHELRHLSLNTHIPDQVAA